MAFEGASRTSAVGNLTAMSLASSAQLFEALRSTAFCVKDITLHYIMANSAMAQLCGVPSRLEVIGVSARELFPEVVRSRHETLDCHVIRTGAILRDQLELCISRDGAQRWLLSHRWPVRDEIGALVGVAMLARMVDAERRNHAGYEKFQNALAIMQRAFLGPCDISSIAEEASMPLSQLKRDCEAVLGMPPRRYLTKLRLDAALEKLATDTPIVEVAHACGYPDQAAFTRRFRAAIGMSPTAYRRAFVPKWRSPEPLSA